MMTHEGVMKFLDDLYGNCLNGIPNISPNVEEMAEDYLEKYKTPEKASRMMINTQIVKCTTSGVLTGFGGLITLPVTIPANLGSVLYVQMRMIAAIAYMGGYDLRDDETRAFVYACLAGVSINSLLKPMGIKLGMKLATSAIKKIPGKILTKINQRVGFRFLTKFGTKGIINLVKLVPAAGAVVGGLLDYTETNIISQRAYKWFIEGNCEPGKDEEIIEAVEWH